MNPKRDEEKGMPTLVARDINHGNIGTGMLFARLVPAKGVNPYAVKSLAKDIAALGYTELVLKSDGEPAISALKQAVRMERHERIVFESSLVKESKSNGAAENAVQQVQGQFRAMKDSFEARVRARISGESPLVPWMIMHAARTINRYPVGQDGKNCVSKMEGQAVSSWRG